MNINKHVLTLCCGYKHGPPLTRCGCTWRCFCWWRAPLLVWPLQAVTAEEDRYSSLDWQGQRTVASGWGGSVRLPPLASPAEMKKIRSGSTYISPILCKFFVKKVKKIMLWHDSFFILCGFGNKPKSFNLVVKELSFLIQVPSNCLWRVCMWRMCIQGRSGSIKHGVLDNHKNESFYTIWRFCNCQKYHRYCMFFSQNLNWYWKEIKCMKKWDQLW